MFGSVTFALRRAENGLIANEECQNVYEKPHINRHVWLLITSNEAIDPSIKTISVDGKQLKPPKMDAGHVSLMAFLEDSKLSHDSIMLHSRGGSFL